MGSNTRQRAENRVHEAIDQRVAQAEDETEAYETVTRELVKAINDERELDRLAFALLVADPGEIEFPD
jgi:hypothetical protein